MILNGIEYGRVWNASGARGFFGEPNCYWFHPPLRPFGLDWRGSTFVAKTTTLEPRTGNMPLDGIRPREWKPKCIRVNFRKGAVLNAVGLSGPGLRSLIEDARWLLCKDPFVLSIATVGDSPAGRREEITAIGRRLGLSQGHGLFDAPFALEVNVSCPNTGHDTADITTEATTWLGIIQEQLPGVPLLPKINALVPVAAAREIATHPACAAIVVSNTLPWGCQPVDGPSIDWRGLFGPVSPLVSLGGGGLSGAPLLPVVRRWITEAVHRNFPVPIVGGGGILSRDDAASLFAVGASAIELGSIAILRPWRVASVINSVNKRNSRLFQGL